MARFINLFDLFFELEFVFAMLYLSILSSLGTSYLSNYALSRLPAAQMSVFNNLATLITILAGVVFLQESFYYYHAIGTILIIAGIIGVNNFGKGRVKHRERKKSTLRRRSV